MNDAPQFAGASKSRPRTWVSWVIILVSLAGILATDRFLVGTSPETDEESALVILSVQAKFMVGAAGFLKGDMGGELRELDRMATTPAIARALAALNAGLPSERGGGPERARELLDRHRYLLEDPEEIALHDAVRKALDGTGDLSDADAGRIERHLKWLGRLLLTHDRPSTDPVRSEVMGAARIAFLAVAVLVLGLMGALLVGIGLLIAAIVMFASGRLKPAFRPPVDADGHYLRAFAVYLFLAFVLSAVPASFGASSIAISIGGVVAASLAGLFWPFFRGVPASIARGDLGLHRGKGLLAETGCGVAGYLAILPILAVGFAVSLGLIVAVESLFPQPPDAPPQFNGHPAALWMSRGNPWLRMLVAGMACLFAPFFEETMFRGALQGSLRSRMGPLPAAVIAGTLFAVIHPQGFLLVPALCSLAVGFSLLREWRDSLIAPMAAHAVHNGILVAFLWVLF